MAFQHLLTLLALPFVVQSRAMMALPMHGPNGNVVMVMMVPGMDGMPPAGNAGMMAPQEISMTPEMIQNQGQGMMSAEQMEQMQAMRKEAESDVVEEIDQPSTVESNIAMMEEIMRKLGEIIERMKAIVRSTDDDVKDVGTEESSKVMAEENATSGMNQESTSGMDKFSDMVQEMARIVGAKDDADSKEPGSNIKVKMTRGCTAMGMFMPVKGDSCSYMQCAYGGVIDSIQLVEPIQMPCPPGLSVSSKFEGGMGKNPCIIDSPTCGMGPGNKD